MIAIVAAFKREVAPFLPHLARRTSFRLEGHRAWKGHVGDQQVIVLIAGMGPERAKKAARALLRSPEAAPLERILSVGFAGGLAPGLEPGDLMAADGLIKLAPDGSFAPLPVDLAGGALATERCGAQRGLLVTAEAIVGTVEGKRALRAGDFPAEPVAVDMEAAAIAEEAAAHGVSVLPLKVVLDGPDEPLRVSLGSLFKLARISGVAARRLSRGIQLVLGQDPRNPFGFYYGLIARKLFGGVAPGTPRGLIPVYPVEVEGLDRLPLGPKILAFNHQSWLDVCSIYGAFPFHVRFLGKIELFRVPILRAFLSHHGVIPLERGDAEGLKHALRELRRGEVIAIFPEGTIPGEEDVPKSAVLPETGLLRGKTGAVRLALASGVPLIPVGISGTGEALPVEAAPHLKRLPIPDRRVKLTMRVGTPFDLGDLGDGANAAEIREATDRLMYAIAALVDRAPADASGTKEPSHV